MGKVLVVLDDKGTLIRCEILVPVDMPPITDMAQGHCQVHSLEIGNRFCLSTHIHVDKEIKSSLLAPDLANFRHEILFTFWRRRKLPQ